MSLINDALKKAQEKRAQEAAAQAPAPVPRLPDPDTISKPPPEDKRPKIPAPPPPANRPQLPIPPPRTTTPPPPAARPATAKLPPIVNYSIPQIEAAEQPATPNNARVRPASSIRYNTSSYEEEGRGKKSSSGTQKKFWIAIGSIAAAAVLVRIIATMGGDEAQSPQKPPAQTPAPQAAVPLPAPSLPPPQPIALPQPKAEPAQAVVAAPAEQEPIIAAKELAPAVTFPPAAPKSAPAATPAISVDLNPAPSAAATSATPPVQTSPTPAATTAGNSNSALPSIYDLRPPTPVTNAMRIQNFIDRLRVTGVRISGRGSKVILNDRMFSIGELVDSGLELRLAKIEQGVITFTDPEGKRYVKLYQ